MVNVYFPVTVVKTVLIYSKTCIKRSCLGRRKSGLIRQVTSGKRLNSYEIFYDRIRKKWRFNTGDCCDCIGRFDCIDDQVHIGNMPTPSGDIGITIGPMNWLLHWNFVRSNQLLSATIWLQNAQTTRFHEISGTSISSSSHLSADSVSNFWYILIYLCL